MDKRIVKTKKCLKEAFLKLRSKGDVDRIKVSELCELAIVNKATFYKHYQDVFALAREVEAETFERVWAGFGEIDSLYTDPEAFLRGMIDVFGAHRGELLVVFGGHLNAIVDMVEIRLGEHYRMQARSQEDSIALSFLVGGATRLTLDPKYAKETIVSVVSKLIASVTLP